MRVRCITDNISDVPSGTHVAQQKFRYFGRGAQRVHLTPQKTYVVYALMECPLGKWIYVVDDDYPSIWYPLGYPLDFFEIMDARVSKIWKPEVVVSFAGERGRLRTFEEWSNDPSFYERLVDKEDLEITIFRKRKEVMDLEYPCREEFKLLTYFDSRWCQCPSCGNVWEDGVHTLGMKRCPACTEILVDGLWTGYNIPQEVH